jgi:hypothetical protein
MTPKQTSDLEAAQRAIHAELARLQKTNPEDARTIARLAKAQAGEELRLAATGFEASHPKLVQAINALCEKLASVGI